MCSTLFVRRTKGWQSSSQWNKVRVAKTCQSWQYIFADLSPLVLFLRYYWCYWLLSVCSVSFPIFIFKKWMFNKKDHQTWMGNVHQHSNWTNRRHFQKSFPKNWTNWRHFRNMECEVSNPAALLGEVEHDTFKQIQVSYFLKIKLLNVPKSSSKWISRAILLSDWVHFCPIDK